METFAIVTTAASTALADLHPRQPAFIDAHDWVEWLAPDTGAERLLALARRSHPRPFAGWAVTRRANNPCNDEPDLLLTLDRLPDPGAQAMASDPATWPHRATARRRRIRVTDSVRHAWYRAEDYAPLEARVAR